MHSWPRFLTWKSTFNRTLTRIFEWSRLARRCVRKHSTTAGSFNFAEAGIWLLTGKGRHPFDLRFSSFFRRLFIIRANKARRYKRQYQKAARETTALNEIIKRSTELPLRVCNPFSHSTFETPFSNSLVPSYRFYTYIIVSLLSSSSLYKYVIQDTIHSIVDIHR